MPPEIIVCGFPKCGTSALMRAFEDNTYTQTLRTPEGGLEIPWPMIQSIDEPVTEGKIRAHKYGGYIYNKGALKYLAENNPNSIIVLCIRDPKKALASWHNMHRSIAKSGTAPTHFAYKERDFYADCSLVDYYERFAKNRLDYDKRFSQLLKIVPKHRILIVSQERMAQDINSIAEYIINLAQGTDNRKIFEPSQESESHLGYADKHIKTLNQNIIDELSQVESRLTQLIKKSGINSIC